MKKRRTSTPQGTDRERSPTDSRRGPPKRATNLPRRHRNAPGQPKSNLETVRFGYFDPDAREVFVAGSFNNWNTHALPMQRDATGNWSVELRLPPGEYLYRLIVDGTWRDHPGAARLVPSQFEGNDAVITV